MSLPTCTHLPRFSCESVPGVTSCRPPGTESPRKRVRCLSPPSTCHGIPAKVFQVSLPAVHLPRNPCESVPGVSFRLPPGSEIPQKCSRCPFLPPTWHGIPAKAFQVSHPAFHLPRKSRKSVSGVSFRRPPGTAIPLIMGCRGFSAGQISSFQHGACSRLHTCSREVCASF